jgi:hypothetical protein
MFATPTPDFEPIASRSPANTIWAVSGIYLAFPVPFETTIDYRSDPDALSGGHLSHAPFNKYVTRRARRPL